MDAELKNEAGVFVRASMQRYKKRGPDEKTFFIHRFLTFLHYFSLSVAFNINSNFLRNKYICMQQQENLALRKRS